MPPESPYQSTLRPEDFAPRPGFRLSIVSILVYVAGVLAHLFVYGGLARLKMGGPTAGVLIGGYVAVFLLAVLISYLAFAFVRSRIGATIVFCLSIPALIFGAMKVNSLADAKLQPALAQATPAPAASVAPGGSPAATPAGNPPYNSTQRGKYSDDAGAAFTVLREAKKKAYLDAATAYGNANVLGAANLTSKEAIAARRQLIAAVSQANEDYLNFITNQEATYRGELEKTPLIPNDVENSVNRFKERNPFIADSVAARIAQRDTLKANDDQMAMLDSSYGRWHLTGGKFSFQKPQDGQEYSRLSEIYQKAAKLQVETLNKLNVEQKALVEGNAPGAAAPAAGAPGAVPAASVPASSPAIPAAAPVPAAPAVSPTP